jgi:hypothetical protein
MTLQHLKELAGKATKGPWSQVLFTSDGSNDPMPQVVSKKEILVHCEWLGSDRDNENIRNASYVAALSPEVIIALVNAVEALKLITEYGDIHGAPSRHATKTLAALDAALGGEK